MICYFNLHGNYVQGATQGTVFISSMFKDKHGFFSHTSSKRDSIAIFTTRSIIRSTWLNQANTYFQPQQRSKG